MHKITPFLWFNSEAEDAAKLYVATFGDGRILDTRRWGPGGPPGYPEGSVMSVTFEVGGREYQAFNGGPGHPFSDAISFFVSVDTQEEIDHFWNALTADGGTEVACGWLADRFGVSWQIVPTILSELLGDPDPGRASRAMQAMLSMTKLDIAQLTAAADGS